MKRIHRYLLPLLFCSPAFAAPDLQPGLWEITTTMEMTGMEGMPAMPPQTLRQCIRPADISNGQAALPKGDPQCEVKDFKLQGNTSTWHMQCRGEHAMSGKGSMTYNGSRYSGKAEFTMMQDGESMTMHHAYRGRRIGDCK